jgi:hypothetical protein
MFESARLKLNKFFITKFGFQEIGATAFKMGSETHLDIVMAVNIT